MKFIHFKDIDLKNPSSWQGKSILTFDMDWAIDEVLDYTLDLLEKAEVKATFFVTHHSKVLDRIRKNQNIETGLHPNFNPLLEKNPSSGTAEEILGNLKKICPDAQVLRSHSMTHSGKWLSLYKQAGIRFTSQYYMNGVTTIQPFEHINGLIEVPVFFADDGFVSLCDEKKSDFRTVLKAIKTPHDFFRVYNFHPVHVALNTGSFSHYESTKSLHSDWNEIVKIRNTGEGIFNLLQSVLNEHST